MKEADYPQALKESLAEARRVIYEFLTSAPEGEDNDGK